MGQLLSQPLTDKVIEYHDLERFSYALGSMQGYRLTQEDAHSYSHDPALEFEDVDGDLTSIDVKIFGIFDGHGGAQSSQYISKELGKNVLRELASRGNPSGKKTTQGLVIQRIKRAFLRTDRTLYQAIHRQHGSQSGSTAILAVIINNEELFTVNTGDSRLVVSLQGSAKNLSFDHKPNHIGELIRINDAGGMVTYNRVGGVLALSRAFGDFGFKMRHYYQPQRSPQSTNNNNEANDDNNANGLKTTATESSSSSSSGSSISMALPPQRLVSEETQVTVEPEIIYHKLTAHDEFIVLACDGIWDVFKNQEVVRYIRHNLVLGLGLNEITVKLLEHSLSLANQVTGVGFDNMSIFIVACQHHGETVAQWYERMRFKIEREKGLV